MPECVIQHDHFLYIPLLIEGKDKSFFSPPAGCSSHNSPAWSCYAKGLFSAFSLSLASLHHQYLPIPWLSAYLYWQCLWLPHHNRTQTLLQHLIYNPALCAAHQQHRRQWLTLLHQEKFPCRTAPRQLHKLTIWHCWPHRLILSDLCWAIVRLHGLASDDGGQYQPSTDTAAYSLIISCQVQYDRCAPALQLHSASLHAPQHRPLRTSDLRHL